MLEIRGQLIVFSLKGIFVIYSILFLFPYLLGLDDAYIYSSPLYSLNY